MKYLLLAALVCFAGCAGPKMAAKPVGLIVIAEGVFILQFEADGSDVNGAMVAVETIEALDELVKELCGPEMAPDLEILTVVPDDKPLITTRVVCVRHISKQDQVDMGGIR